MVGQCLVGLSWAKLSKPQVDLQHVRDITGNVSGGVGHQPGPYLCHLMPEAGLLIHGNRACKSLQLMVVCLLQAFFVVVCELFKKNLKY